MDLVSNWYMRERGSAEAHHSATCRGSTRSTSGHDNNRDFYMSALAETTNMNRQLYREWFPQIMYNHHQTGPAGTVMFAPPFRDPFNYVFDPLIPTSLDLVGAAMHTRFAAEGKPGVTTRRGANYSTWWNGGLRTTAYFHNMIGLLTETIGNPTPMEIPFRPERQLPSGDLPFPIEPQTWHFRQSHRLLDHRQPRGARLRLALPRAVPLQHLADGAQLDRARAARHLDDVPAPRCRRCRRPSAAARPPAGAPARRQAAWRLRAMRRARSSTRCCATRRCATRAATSCRPTRPTSRRRSSSSTR